MNTIVERVTKWYEDHVDQLSAHWSMARIKSLESAHPVRGKVVIEVESATTVAMITFWNKGDVTVLRLDLPAKTDSVVDDRALAESEDVALLLDSYFQQTAAPRR